jgi:DNA sulfur modification protein DndC
MGLLDSVDMTPVKNTIKDAYLLDDRPWIVGFSDGKDSTFMSDLIIESIDELSPEKRKKRVYFISGYHLLNRCCKAGA